VTAGSSGDDSHAVVFDVNVFLTAARWVGTPFTWERFEEKAKERARNWVPSFDKYGGDSAVALWMASSGEFVPGQPLAIWTSDHIENLIYKKAMDPDDRELADEDRGVGWSEPDAKSILDELHDRLIPENQTVNVTAPAGPVSLGREDGLVLATAREAGYHTDIKYCVTKDRLFRATGDPMGNVLVLKPHEFVTLLRQSRQAVSGLRGPRPLQP
jgi:hypothetical protein